MFSTSVTILIAFILFVGMAGQFLSSRQRTKRKPESVEAVSKEFDLLATPPVPYRPFKAGAYHLTMGLMKATYQDWIVLDNEYDYITDYRAATHKRHWDRTNLVAEPETRSTRAAVVELYERVFGYLCRKYPQYFVVDGPVIVNKLKDRKVPLECDNISSKQLLAILAENTVDDYLLLEYDPVSEEYVCKVMTASFPSGFDSTEKLNKKLTDIHVPYVPGYEQKLKRSMNKYFHRVEFPHIVQRLNWSVQPQGANLHSPSTNHANPNDTLRALTVKDLDFENEVFLRVEKQLLSRLPDSNFLLFTVRTHMTQMKQLKREGLGETFCAAIDGVPADMAQYKCVPQWGDAVKEYLRS